MGMVCCRGSGLASVPRKRPAVLSQSCSSEISVQLWAPSATILCKPSESLSLLMNGLTIDQGPKGYFHRFLGLLLLCGSLISRRLALSNHGHLSSPGVWSLFPPSGVTPSARRFCCPAFWKIYSGVKKEWMWGSFSVILRDHCPMLIDVQCPRVVALHVLSRFSSCFHW